MSLFTVDQEKCKRDGHCVAECPARIIEMQDRESFPSPIDGAEELCIKCGHCVSVCPHGAMSLNIMTPDECPPMRKDLLPTAEQTEHFFRARRSIRTYKAEPVDQTVLTRLIEMARYAPSGHNLQPVHWLVIDSPDQMKRLTSLAHGTQGAPPAQAACTIALAYLELAAFSMGLGSCWAGYFNAAAGFFPPLQKALALPKGHQCYGAMMIGYPKFQYHRLPLRNEAKVTWRR
jgi:nitroreductase/NAD-dependent dihydropyrimidine dehydrogenase PreA subunit